MSLRDASGGPPQRSAGPPFRYLALMSGEMSGESRDDGDRCCDPVVAGRYDVLLADQLVDVRFYGEGAGRVPGPVLEAGCGTGRVTLPIAEAGVRVVGLDRSPHMLKIAEAKRRAATPDVASRCAFVRAVPRPATVVPASALRPCPVPRRRSRSAAITSHSTRRTKRVRRL